MASAALVGKELLRHAVSSAISNDSEAHGTNIPELDGWVGKGWDLTAVVPSCVLMFKRELPLLFRGRARAARRGRSTIRSST
jgi:hypothetical protein